VLPTEIVHFHLWVLVTIDVHRGHLRLQFLDIVKVFLRDVVDGAIEGTLKLVVKGLKQEVEAVEAEFVTAGQDQHLPVHLVVELIAVGAVVSAVARG